MAQPVWNTPAGSLGTYPSGLPIAINLSASPQLPGTSLTYSLISGSLPAGTSSNPIRLTSNGLITGTPDVVFLETTNTFTVRATDNTGSLRDRTFSISISGTSEASFTTPEGSILSVNDSIWVDIQIEYDNPNPENLTRVELAQGLLPNGLQLSPSGVIRGYASPPISGDGSPTTRTFQFTLSLTSENNGEIISIDYATYSITIINQNIINPPNTRLPVVLNNRPLTIVPSITDPFYGYYIDVNSTALGVIQSGDYFAFKIIGYDFDNDNISYTFVGLPLGLSGDSDTGWITGIPLLNNDSINQYSFQVLVQKVSNPSINTGLLTFTLIVSKNVDKDIAWITGDDLGSVFNGTISTLRVEAEASVELEYRLISGSLPPNTTLLSSGEIVGKIAQQPSTTLKSLGDTTEFTATIEAYSPQFPLITSTKTFTVSVYQEYTQPFETLYIKAAPTLSDRRKLELLLDNDTIIPESVLYRPFDIYFGKATSVIYEHAFGIYASNINQYLAAVTRNHYWRQITLGELKTAIARNSQGEIIYEVVYSEVIDNLVNPEGQSISSRIVWPFPINLNQGPWYTSITNIYTSYAFNNVSTQSQMQLDGYGIGNYMGTENNIDMVTEGLPQFYTSLSPGFVRELYPNSLYNMRNRVADVLGQEQDSRILPEWMTSQQLNGSTLGYTQAWVICYTKPGFANTVKNNIETLWPYELNQINITIDRFTVDKSTTYDWDNSLQPPNWTGLPSADPTPDPLDSKDFYVLFPRQTILPRQP